MSGGLMRAAVVTGFSDPDVFEIAEMLDPPGPGQVAIDVSHASVGLIDIYLRRSSTKIRGVRHRRRWRLRLGRGRGCRVDRQPGRHRDGLGDGGGCCSERRDCLSGLDRGSSLRARRAALGAWCGGRAGMAFPRVAWTLGSASVVGAVCRARLAAAHASTLPYDASSPARSCPPPPVSSVSMSWSTRSAGRCKPTVFG